MPLAGLTLLMGAGLAFAIVPASATTTFSGTMSVQGGSENPGGIACASASNCGTLWAGYNWTIPGGPTGGHDSVDLTSLTWTFPYTCTGSGSGTFTLTAPSPGAIDATGTGHYPTANAGSESSNESWEAVPITLTNGCTSGTPIFTENNGTFTAPFTATTADTINYQSHASFCPDNITVPGGSNPNQTAGCAAGSWGPTAHVTPTAVASTTTATTATLTGSNVVGGGGSITDMATVTGSLTAAPTGTVTFYECGPTTTASPCAATGTPYSSGPVDTSSGNPSTASSSPAFTPTGGAGFYCFSAVYTPPNIVSGPEAHSVTIPYGPSSTNTTSDNFDAAECVQLVDATTTTVTTTTIASGSNTGGNTPVTPAAATPAAAAPAAVAGATVVTTGEPFAGSKPIEAAVALLGMGLLTMGLLRRRSLRRGAEARNR